MPSCRVMRSAISHPQSRLIAPARCLPPESPDTSKVLDLLSDDLDTSFIRGIEFQNVVSVRVASLSCYLLSIDLSCNAEDGTRFACSGRTVEQHVGKRVGSEEIVDCVWVIEGLYGRVKQDRGGRLE